MKKTQYLSLLLMFTLLFVVNSVAFAENSLKSIKERGYILVGTNPEYPPFELINEKGKLVGFDIDLFEAMAKEIGIKVKWHQLGFETIIGALKSTQIDAAISGLSVTEERRKHVEFSDPYYLSGQVVVVLEESPLKSLKELKGKRASAGIGTIGAYAAEKIDGVTVITPESNALAFMMLRNNSADVVVADIPVADAYIRRGGFRQLGKPLSFEEIAIGFTKGNTELAKAFNVALAKVKADGTYEKLLIKWKIISK